MIIIDMESTGLDPVKSSLVSLGALDFDNPANQFYMECRAWEGSHIEDEALAVNGFSREQVTDSSKKSDRELVEAFLEWIKTCKEYTLAGQNPAIDRDFLKATAYRYHINWPLAQRTIDLHTVAYFHMIQNGRTIPLKHNHSDLNLPKILEYVELSEQPKPHNGLTDAKLEAEALSRLMYGKNLLPEFAGQAVPAFLKRG